MAEKILTKAIIKILESNTDLYFDPSIYTTCIGTNKINKKTLGILVQIGIPEKNVNNRLLIQIGAYLNSKGRTGSLEEKLEEVKEAKKVRRAALKSKSSAPAPKYKPANPMEETFIETTDQLIDTMNKCPNIKEFIDAEELEQVFDSFEGQVDKSLFDDVHNTVVNTYQRNKEILEMNQDYPNRMVRNKNGNIVACEQNYHNWFRGYEIRNKVHIYYESETTNLYLRQVNNDVEDPKDVFEQVGVNWYECLYAGFYDKIPVSKTLFYSILVKFIDDNNRYYRKFDMAFDKLRLTKTWDGKDNVKRLLELMGGYNCSEERYNYHYEMLFKAIAGAYIKMTKPGSRVDFMTILSDETQGTGKTTILSRLFSEGLGLEQHVSTIALTGDVKIDDDEAVRKMSGKGLVLFDESAQMLYSVAKVEKLKGNITQNSYTIRPLYVNQTVSTKRSDSYFMTTNEVNFLKLFTDKPERRWHILTLKGEQHLESEYWKQVLPIEFLEQVWLQVMDTVNNDPKFDVNSVSESSMNEMTKVQIESRCVIQNSVEEQLFKNVLFLNKANVPNLTSSEKSTQTAAAIKDIKTNGYTTFERAFNYEIGLLKEYIKTHSITLAPVSSTPAEDIVKVLSEAVNTMAKPMPYHTRYADLKIYVADCSSKITNYKPSTILGMCRDFLVEKKFGKGSTDNRCAAVTLSNEEVISYKLEEMINHNEYATIYEWLYQLSLSSKPTPSTPSTTTSSEEESMSYEDKIKAKIAAAEEKLYNLKEQWNIQSSLS